MEDLTGRQFGPYRIVAALGEGGMAAVYEAYQPGMDRFVALKVLPRHFASDPQFVSRFRHEARVLAQLQHPHILPVFDFGESDGYTFLAMPFVQGGTLSARLDGKPLPFATAERIIRQVCEAIGYAHAKGVVHRDIKPSNVLIDETGNCLVADFGLARLVDGPTKLTVTGALIGTPAYMSPEQAEGKPAGPASDVYALGIVAYEMLTGRVPFTAETPVAVLVKHLNAPLPPPRTFNPGLAPEIEAVILKALARAKDDRYLTPSAFSDALAAAISLGQQTAVRGRGEDFGARETVVTPRPQRSESTTSKVAEPTRTVDGIRVDRTASVNPSPQPAATEPRHPMRLSSALLVAIAGIAVGAAGVGFFFAARLRETPTATQTQSRSGDQVAKEPATSNAAPASDPKLKLPQPPVAVRNPDSSARPSAPRSVTPAGRAGAAVSRPETALPPPTEIALEKLVPRPESTPSTTESTSVGSPVPAFPAAPSSPAAASTPLPFGFNGELQPGRSTRSTVERAFGSPIEQVSQYVFDYRPPLGTTVLYVVYRADDVMDAIGVSFVSPYSRNYLARSLNLPTEPQSAREAQGHLFEYYGAPAYVVLAYASTEIRSGISNLRHYSAEMFDREAPPISRPPKR